MKIAVVLLVLACSYAYTEEDDVLILGDGSLDQALDEFDHLLVEFYAPWCGHCKQLAPHYAKAAARLKAHDPPIRIASVESTTNPVVTETYEVKGYPTLKYFVNKEPREYEGGRTEETIISWLLKEQASLLQTQKSQSALDGFLETVPIAAVLFADSKGTEESIFEEVVNELNKPNYAICPNKEVATAMGVKYPGLVILKHSDDKRVDYTGSLTSKHEIEDFVTTNQVPWFMQYNDDSGKLLFQDHGVALILTRREGDASHEVIDGMVQELRKQFLLMYVDLSDPASRQAGQMLANADASVQPALWLVDATDEETTLKYMNKGEITPDTTRQFIADWKDQKLDAIYKSAKVPSKPYDGHVRVLVGKNFDDVVYHPDKDVLVEFYAPWCGHCKALAPEYEEAAKRIRTTLPNTILAKVDSTESEIAGISVKGFPTLYWFPADDKTPEKYQGGRNADGLVDFLEQNSKASRMLVSADL